MSKDRGPYWDRTSFRPPVPFVGDTTKRAYKFGQIPRTPSLLGRPPADGLDYIWEAPEGVNVSKAGDDHDAPYAVQAAARAERRKERGLPPQIRKKRRGAESVLVTGRMAELLNGEITVEDLDDEELMSGSLRDQSGKLASNNRMIPKSMHQELMRRILQRGQEKIRTDYFGALDVVSSIMYDDQLDPSIRLRAANMVIERIAGKTPEKVELSVEVKKYEDVAVSIVRELPENTIEAEIVDE